MKINQFENQDRDSRKQNGVYQDGQSRKRKRKKTGRFPLPAVIASSFILAAAGTGYVWASSSADETSALSGTVLSDLTGTTVSTSVSSATDTGLDTTSMFSERDLEQEPDTSDAETITVQDDSDITITEEGVYVITGTASNCTIRVEAADDAKVQLVLDGVQITNDSSPAIYVVSADKVFVTTASSGNSLSVTGTFTADGDTNTDAVIFAKDDITLNGTGDLTISSTANAISAKDELVVTGGTYDITCTEDALEANDSIAVCGGTFVIDTEKDGLHSENSDDDTVGWIYISDGDFTITAGDDGIQATTVLQIDGGTFNISAVEGLEATSVEINDGTFDISASDDGINASQKSTACSIWIEINGGTLTITMGSGDTDAVDSNGSITVNGGTIDITAQSAFDYMTSGTLNGGTVTVNGSQVTELTGGFGSMGGFGGGNAGGNGGMGGGFGGRGNGGF